MIVISLGVFSLDCDCSCDGSILNSDCSSSCNVPVKKVQQEMLGNCGGKDIVFAQNLALG